MQLRCSQVIGVVHVNMVRMQFDETVGGGDGRGLITVSVISIGDFKLRLLRITAIGIACFKGLEQLDGLFIIAVIHFRFGFGIEFARRPVFGLIGFFR